MGDVMHEDLKTYVSAENGKQVMKTEIFCQKTIGPPKTSRS